MRTSLREVHDIRGIVKQCPTLETLDGIGKWMCHAATGGNDMGQLPIRCRGGFFEDEFVEIGEPCLWIFDCRQGATEGDDVP
jgi:hypothetical protein